MGDLSPPGRVRILMIDDNPFDRELARWALDQLPAGRGRVELVCAGDWPEAAPMVEADGLDLVLLDYHLPTLSGLEILGELSGRPHPPVIMMTGQDDVTTAVETLRSGACDYVPKSADWGPALCLAVERVLDRARLEHELAESRARLVAYAAELEHKVAMRTAVVRAQATEIEQLYLKAEEAARVKAEIVANVSHELRTPLNVIVGYADLLEDYIGSADATVARDMLAKVRAQADRLRVLVESLLALGRLTAGQEDAARTRFRLGDLVEQLRRETDALNAERGLVIAWNVSPASSEIEHDRDKLRVIVYHLVSNAIKFTHAGRVDIDLTVSPAGDLLVVVTDTGIGLPPDAADVVFEDFRQLDGSSTRRYEGLGLGLGIVRRYAELLGGRVALASAPGEGTRVTVELPAGTRVSAAAR